MNDTISMDKDQFGNLEVKTNLQKSIAKYQGEKIQIHRGQI